MPHLRSRGWLPARPSSRVFPALTEVRSLFTGRVRAGADRGPCLHGLCAQVRVPGPGDQSRVRRRRRPGPPMPSRAAAQCRATSFRPQCFLCSKLLLTLSGPRWGALLLGPPRQSRRLPSPVPSRVAELLQAPGGATGCRPPAECPPRFTGGAAALESQPPQACLDSPWAASSCPSQSGECPGRHPGVQPGLPLPPMGPVPVFPKPLPAPGPISRWPRVPVVRFWVLRCASARLGF